MTTYVWNGVDFAGPIRLLDWLPPLAACVYAIMTPAEKAGRFRLVYVGESGHASDAAFFARHEKHTCWLEQAGSEDKIYVGLHPMPDSSRDQRRVVMAQAIGALRLACQGYRPVSSLNTIGAGKAGVIDELSSARERKRQSEERARLYFEKIRKAEAEVADYQRELTAGQQRLAELLRQKADLDRRMGELTNNITGAKQGVETLQRNISSHKLMIAADQAEMEKHNAEVQRLDHTIADLMRRR